MKPAPPPVTTDVRVVAGVADAFRDAGYSNIIVAEGSGTGDTVQNLIDLGYGALGLPLVDLDSLPNSPVNVPDAEVWPVIHLPDIIRGAFIVSVPVLKDHSMLGVTIGLKNMVGVLPADHYSGYWAFRKSMIHKENPHGCVSDLIRAARPDWTIVDATVGMRESHVYGAPMNPPANLVFGSADSLEADKFGAELLGHNWLEIEYLRKISVFWR
ncbi:MAG: DUF362 domain-containing protein [Nitrospirae bacterium]|nr:DUF362 domain-containing protein [Nitrospirota bacterium]